MGQVIVAKVGVSYIPKGEKKEHYFQAGETLDNLTPKVLKALQEMDAVFVDESDGGTE